MRRKFHSQRLAASVALIGFTVAAGAARATILGTHAFTWWDDPVVGGVTVTPIGALPPSANATPLINLREWHIDQAQTTAWFNGLPVAGLPVNPFNPANRTGLIGAIPAVVGSQAFIYEITNLGFASGNGFTFSTPVPPGPGVNDLSGINIIDGAGVLAGTLPVAGSQFMFTNVGGSSILDMTGGAVLATPQDWNFNAFAGPGNWEWDIRSENGSGVLPGAPPAVFGFAMPGSWEDIVESGWIHSWNAPNAGQPLPNSGQVNIANGRGFSGPTSVPEPVVFTLGMMGMAAMGIQLSRRRTA